MAAPNGESGIEGPGGCFAALAIGPLTVAAVYGAVALLAGRPIDPGEEWPFILLQMALVSLPFLFLAAVGARSRSTWLTGLGLTFFFWGWLLLDALTMASGRGANIGLGWILLASPALITAASLGVWAHVERGGNERE